VFQTPLFKNIYLKTFLRTIYLARHGESLNNVVGRLGGDSKLTVRGEEFAKRLGEYVNQLQHPNFKVWTSWLQRTIDTAEHIEFDQERYLKILIKS
jgi:6-phosphofructo-2-kinase/fructose-2,6-biphosphatase 2